MQRIAIVIALVGLMLAIVIGATVGGGRPLEPGTAMICLLLGGLAVAVATVPVHKDK